MRPNKKENDVSYEPSIGACIINLRAGSVGPPEC